MPAMSDYLPWPWTPLQRYLDSSFAALQRHQDDRFTALQQTLKELKTMSESLSQQLDDADVRIEAALAKLSTDLTDIAAELKANTPNPGSMITQAQADRNLAIATNLESLAAAADAMATPSAPPTP
jgi:septal ring factor EnvC (AmiA/AmiB activator)